jgi:hypothetical protein
LIVPGRTKRVALTDLVRRYLETLRRLADYLRHGLRARREWNAADAIAAGATVPTNVEIVNLMESEGQNHCSPDVGARSQRYMSPALRVVEPQSLPYGGVFQGAKQLAEFESIFFETWSHHRCSVQRYAQNADCVAAYLDLELISRATGRTIRTRVAEWWRLEAGQVTDIEVFYEDTAAVLAAIAP